MKHITSTLLYSYTLIACLISCLSLSGLHRARQVGRLADTINKTHGNLRSKQNALASTFKTSITNRAVVFKPVVLQKIVTAAARNSRYKHLQSHKNCIESAIDQFHDVPGFLTLLSRLVTGIVVNNVANVNGALAEMSAALEKSSQHKKILAFGKSIKNERGKTLTEIDLITQDENGAIAWEEIKTRTKLRENDHALINAQNVKQRDLARQAGVKHTLTIHFTDSED